MTIIAAVPTATVTTTGPAEAVAAVPKMAGYLTLAAAAERTGRTPWAVRELVEGGQLAVAAFNGRPYVEGQALDRVSGGVSRLNGKRVGP
ncbi:hypothetical protein [Nocardioides sp. zg-1228]|uniref:hypothetical protein n=1 Tax=Nocardioides sp. zg-1228 TaxID=2763008 RepID=UPI00164236E0|nr:hypothetical protein [Nocardioides sp. zg-1228]MBC2933039.1 hypothetical protein [Nocardioides sp. zg-1228]QSF56767.1 hypothetical protein JX575_14320 [Nocardioides sp. zg-1228]